VGFIIKSQKKSGLIVEEPNLGQASRSKKAVGKILVLTAFLTVTDYYRGRCMDKHILFLRQNR
jgi:hypothetical protein